MKNKKVLIMGGVVIVVFAIVLVFLFSHKKEKEFLITPIQQTSLSSSKKEISLKSLDEWVKDKDFFLWKIENNVQLEKVKEIANSSGLELNFSSESYFYEWRKDEKFIKYNLSTNTLIASGDDIFVLDSLELETSSIFSLLVQKYFGFDWEYEVFNVVKAEDGITKYYAKRYVGDNLVEKDLWDNQTDNLVIRDGKIISVNLLLSQFTNTNKITPLISQKELKTFINQRNYPKTDSFDFGVIIDEPNYEEMMYDSKEWEKINKSIRDCKADKISVVYLYKDMAQEYLTPVYKIEAQCTMTYRKKDYFIPSTWYVNAINPELILTNDKK